MLSKFWEFALTLKLLPLLQKFHGVRLFGTEAKYLSMSSTKSSMGHLLGAAGSVEAILSILAMNNGVVPPTLNLDNPPENCEIDLVPKVAKEKKFNAAMSNSFGFGGTNATLIFKKI